jgi:hypothetical protein
VATQSEARSEPKRQYRRRQPELTVLYKVIQENWLTFLARIQEQDRQLPCFITKEFESYLTCGIPAEGSLEVECPRCKGFIVAYSCKKRGFCPSCMGRRMNELAAHLVDHVVPEVPLRAWVFTVPHPLRYLMAYDKSLCSAVISLVHRTLFQFIRNKAKKELGLESVSLAFPGAISFLQRSGSSANLHPHLHDLVLDGVYVKDQDGQAQFHELSPPTEDELAEILSRLALRVQNLLEKRDQLKDDSGLDTDRLALDEPLLAHLAASSIRNVDAISRHEQPTRRLQSVPPMPYAGNGQVVRHDGYSLFVGPPSLACRPAMAGQAPSRSHRRSYL